MSSPSSVRVFADLLSQPSRAVVLFCRANDIPHTLREVKIMGMVNQTAGYRKINPLKTVPCIEDGDLVLRDSGAILAYLANTRKDFVKEHWYPKDLQKRARVDEYLSWHHLNTRAGCSQLLLFKWIRPLLTGKPANPEKIASCEKFQNKALDAVEKIWLDGGRAKFVSGSNEITIADLQLACELEQPILAGYDLRKERPVLKDYLDRVSKELSPHYDEVHKPLWSLAERFPNGQVPSKAYAAAEFAKARIGLIMSPL